MTVRFVSALALIALVATPALADDPVAATPAPAAPAAAPAAADDYASLPAGDGRDVTVRVCAQCHSPEVVAHQNLDAQGWKDLVNQMANNGANGTDAEFETISKYLTTAFPQH
jgi:mono/diheme cytochrome c family protein